MNRIEVATLYVGLNILILLTLIVLVIIQRQKHKCAIGDGGHTSLMLAIRAHANAIEVIPVTLVGFVALASIGASAPTIHILGATLTAGRVLHAYGLSRSGGTSFGRMSGMLLSLAAMAGTAIMCLRAALM